MIRDARSWGLLFMAGVCGSRAVAYLPGRPERAENGVTNAFLFWALAGVIACLLLIPPRRLR